MILFGGLGFPRPQTRGRDACTLWGSIPVPKSLDTKVISGGQTISASSPYLDEMMMTNVRQFQIQRFPNDKRFQNKTFAEVVNSGFRYYGLLRKMVMGYG